MAGILQTAVFSKSHPFSKLHPCHIGISTFSTEKSKSRPFAKFQPFGCNFEKGRDFKKTAVCKIPSNTNLHGCICNSTDIAAL
jgi:hypothetical protein